jgi:hypothetical protein
MVPPRETLGQRELEESFTPVKGKYLKPFVGDLDSEPTTKKKS